MIKSIHGMNFQSWKNLTLDFNTGVNAIVGPSDYGKTVTFRLLDWIINNRPSGNEFHSWSGGDPYGAIILNEGIQITRTKIKSSNYYLLTKPKTHRQILNILKTKPEKRKKEDQVFEAFGNKVPGEISNILDIAPINFHFQLADPFMLSKSQTPGKIAKQLNEVVDLKIIDTALSNINSRYREENNNLKREEENYKDLKEEAESYKWLPKAEGCISKLEALDSKINQLKKQSDQLNKHIDSIKEATEKLNRFKKRSSIIYETKVKSLIKLDNKIDELENKIDELESLTNSILRIKTDIKDRSLLLKLEPEVKRLLELNSDTDKKHKVMLDLISHQHQIQTTKENITTLSARIKNEEKEFKKLMPNICPLCRQEPNICSSCKRKIK